nr:MAG TPA: hypothetical protein [Caudoviricetes sp.]
MDSRLTGRGGKRSICGFSGLPSACAFFLSPRIFDLAKPQVEGCS